MAWNISQREFLRRTGTASRRVVFPTSSGNEIEHVGCPASLLCGWYPICYDATRMSWIQDHVRQTSMTRNRGSS